MKTNKTYIAINGTVFKNPITGVAKRLIHLILELKKLNSHLEFIIFSPNPFYIRELEDIRKVIIPTILGEWFWLNFIVPFLLQKYTITIFDSIWGGGLPTLFPFLKRCKYIVTYHDFIELDKIKDKNNPTFFSQLKYFLLKKKIQKHLCLADKVIFISPELLKKFQCHFHELNPNTKKMITNKVFFSPNGINIENTSIKSNSLYSRFIKKHKIKKYFFYVGGFNPRKNVENLIEAYQIYSQKAKNPITLILCGEENKYFHTYIAPKMENTTNVFSIGYLSENDLKIFYQNMTTLIYPSLREGFGMPPLEALSWGKKSLVDKNLPLLAWKLKGILSIDMRKTQEITKAMLKTKMDSLTTRSIEQLKPFVWKNIAQEYNKKIIHPFM